MTRVPPRLEAGLIYYVSYGHTNLVTAEAADFSSWSTDHLRLPHRPLPVLFPRALDPRRQEQRAASHLYFDLDAPVLATPPGLPHPLAQLLLDQSRLFDSNGRERACQVWAAERLHEQVHFRLSMDDSEGSWF
jgi:hypothetical protein